MKFAARVMALFSIVARLAPTGGYVEVGEPPEGPWQGNHLTDPRDDGTCCQGVADCGGVTAENTGGWGHVGRDLRFYTPYNDTLNTSTVKYTPRPYKLDITGGYVYNMSYYEGEFIYAATGSTGQGLRMHLKDCDVCSPYWQTTGLWTARRSDPTLGDLAAKMPSRTPLSPNSRRNLLMHIIGKTNLNNRRLLSNNTTSNTTIPLVSAEVALPVWTQEAGPGYFPVASYHVVPRNGNMIRKHHGIHIPKCSQQDVIPPTRLDPVPKPTLDELIDGQGGTELIPPAPPVPGTMVCWDGTVCPGRSAQEGIQCCSAPVMAGDTCAQIFICDQRRTCTGPRACYQQFDSLWDVNNNGWQLAGIVTFICVMTLFLCLFLTYCCCDRCIINRRKYAAQRERKRYLTALPSLSSLEAQA